MESMMRNRAPASLVALSLAALVVAGEARAQDAETSAPPPTLPTTEDSPSDDASAGGARADEDAAPAQQAPPFEPEALGPGSELAPLPPGPAPLAPPPAPRALPPAKPPTTTAPPTTSPPPPKTAPSAKPAPTQKPAPEAKAPPASNVPPDPEKLHDGMTWREKNFPFGFDDNLHPATEGSFVPLCLLNSFIPFGWAWGPYVFFDESPDTTYVIDAAVILLWHALSVMCFAPCVMGPQAVLFFIPFAAWAGANLYYLIPVALVNAYSRSLEVKAARAVRDAYRKENYEKTYEEKYKDFGSDDDDAPFVPEPASFTPPQAF